MRAIDRKWVRDLLSMRGQALAIASVIAAGVATFVLANTTHDSLLFSQRRYYREQRFADVFSRLERAPAALKRSVAEIPGVARVDDRIVVDVNLSVDGLDEPVVGRLISLPRHEGEGLNEVVLRQGRPVEPGRWGEVLVSEAFAIEHDMVSGDRLVAIINGRRRELYVTGIVLSPEYILQVRESEILPDPKRFGVFWMDRRELAAAVDMAGAFNDLSLTLLRGTSETEVIRQLDSLSKRYGGTGAYGRHQHASHQFLSDEIRQLESMARVLPLIFLGVAAFLLNVVVSRLVAKQREQIAALKAFGYSHREIGLHYLKPSLTIAAFGTLLGCLAGVWLGRSMTAMYATFYRFPFYVYKATPSVFLAAAGISLLSAIAGAWGAVRRAVRLPPAEAMRPEPPSRFRPTLLERLGLHSLLSPATRMIFRQLERRPFKSFFSSLGVALATAVLVLGNYVEDSLDALLDFQFRVAQCQDMIVTLIKPASGRVAHELANLPGVLVCEPFRSVASRIVAGHRSRRVGILSLSVRPELFRLIDAEGNRVELPEYGVVISKKLAEVLAVDKGDRLRVEVLEGARPVWNLLVAEIVPEYEGMNAYVESSVLARLLHEETSVTGAFLSVDRASERELYRTLKSIPQVASVTIKSAALHSFRETIAESLLVMKAFIVVLAAIIALGVVYNSARISLSERSRELATLRVIGFTRREVGAILLGELAILTGLAIPMGLALGYFFSYVSSLSLDTELYRIPLVVNISTYAYSALVVVIAATLSGLVVLRRISRLDLIAVLKTRE